MKVNGHMIQGAIRELTHQREIAAAQFGESLYAFPDEKRPRPGVLVAAHRECDVSIAQLQVLQARYNLAVTVEVDPGKMTLHEAVKRVGGAGRVEKMWREAAKDLGRGRYDSRTLERSATTVTASRTVTVEECMAAAKIAGRHAAALRAAIQRGNVVEVDFENVDPDLFK